MSSVLVAVQALTGDAVLCGLCGLCGLGGLLVPLGRRTAPDVASSARLRVLCGQLLFGPQNEGPYRDDDA